MVVMRGKKVKKKQWPSLYSSTAFLNCIYKLGSDYAYVKRLFFFSYFVFLGCGSIKLWEDTDRVKKSSRSVLLVLIQSPSTLFHCIPWSVNSFGYTGKSYYFYHELYEAFIDIYVVDNIDAEVLLWS